MAVFFGASIVSELGPTAPEVVGVFSESRVDSSDISGVSSVASKKQFTVEEYFFGKCGFF